MRARTAREAKRDRKDYPAPRVSAARLGPLGLKVSLDQLVRSARLDRKAKPGRRVRKAPRVPPAVRARLDFLVLLGRKG
jgi:hypothetical protein